MNIATLISKEGYAFKCNKNILYIYNYFKTLIENADTFSDITTDSDGNITINLDMYEEHVVRKIIEYAEYARTYTNNSPDFELLRSNSDEQNIPGVMYYPDAIYIITDMSPVDFSVDPSETRRVKYFRTKKDFVQDIAEASIYLDDIED